MNKAYVHGFHLIELIIYLAIITSIGSVAISFGINSYQKLTLYNQQLRKIMQLYAAENFLRRDIHGGSNDPACWHVTNDGQLVWNIGDKYVSWCSGKNKSLIRIEGIYDVSTGIWQNKFVSIIAHDIINLCLQLNNNQSLNNVSEVKSISVAITYAKDHKEIVEHAFIAAPWRKKMAIS